ncbi:helix-turn-helix transcriptional regulator [Kitasatospora sp. NPDC085464]|uniref:helix-turn-helix transcriptional regulator n=1 Tax=Kitasatospora sp. NPDC085464 TaxID=3364063 RepID=UPI0037C6E044
MVNIREIDPESSRWGPFGVLLRRSRLAVGLTQGQLAKRIGCHPSTVSVAETATKQVSRRFAEKADEVLGTNGSLTLMWLQASNSAGLAEGFAEFSKHEAQATEIRLFEIGAVPGLFQTRSYAEAELAGAVDLGEVTTDQAEERLEFRMARQKFLERTPPPLVFVALDESALRWQLGGPAVMVEQLRRLEDLADGLPNMLIQVVPFTMGVHRSFRSAVTLLTVGDNTQLGYTETLHRGFLERDRATVVTWRRRYDRLQVDAPTRADSLAMIRSIRKEMAP